MKLSDKDRSILIRALCKEIGLWANESISLTDTDATSIRDSSYRLIDLLDARELSLLRRRGGGNYGEGGS